MSVAFIFSIGQTVTSNLLYAKYIRKEFRVQSFTFQQEICFTHMLAVVQ